jgi:transposase
MKEGARIYWGDEMGIQSTDNRGKTYGLKGKTPAIKRSGSRFKCNMLAAISPQGFMNWMVFEDNFTSKKCIEFLGRLIRQIKQKIFLILDNHRVHHSKKVKAYVERHKDKLELFYLPPYCPDINPQELVNQDVKANSNNFRVLKSVKDLTNDTPRSRAPRYLMELLNSNKSGYTLAKLSFGELNPEEINKIIINKEKFI